MRLELQRDPRFFKVMISQDVRLTMIVFSFYYFFLNSTAMVDMEADTDADMVDMAAITKCCKVGLSCGLVASCCSEFLRHDDIHKTDNSCWRCSIVL